MNKKIVRKYLLSFTFMLVIMLLFMAGAYWLIVREYPVEGKSNFYIVKNEAMRVAGIIGLILSTPWILAIIKNIVLLLCDFISNETITCDIEIGSNLEFYLPRHSFYVVDSFRSKNKIMIYLFLFWNYVFKHSYYFLDMEMANVNHLRQKRKSI